MFCPATADPEGIISNLRQKPVHQRTCSSTISGDEDVVASLVRDTDKNARGRSAGRSRGGVEGNPCDTSAQGVSERE